MPGEIAGHILTARGFVAGTLDHRDGRIRRIDGVAVSDERAHDDAQSFVLPGFVDSHVHG